MNENSPIRIAHIMGKWIGGGVESVVMNYYRHIDKSKIQFDFLCDEDSTNIPYEEIESLGGKVILIPPYQKPFKYHKELKRILKEGNYKIVHSHISTMSFFSLWAAQRAGIPIRITHSHSTTNKQEWKKNLLKQILRPLSKIFSTDYMCCSKLSGEWLFGKETYNKGKVYLLNNAIELEKFAYKKAKRLSKREELGIPSDSLCIGHIGRFVQQKNHDFLIDIFYEYKKMIKKSILVLAGQGPLENEIKEKVKRLGLSDSVKFLGQRDDVQELYQAFDVFVLPSLYEGLPVVGVEAQASGLFCVFSDDMTPETKLLPGTKFLSLKDGSKTWAYTIFREYNPFDRKNTIKDITEYGFNIKEEAHKLVDKYLELLAGRL